MYAGLNITNQSGNLLGFHQKMDRLSRDALDDLLNKGEVFPSKRQILHFEGKNGPDGIKLKSAGNDEPWYFFDPDKPESGELLTIIKSHYGNLVKELSSKNKERSAFEAAWLAHALLDGLTPAHQYPYEEELEKIRGESKDTRNTIYKKIVAPAETGSDMIAKNWQLWGAKGLVTTHALFEGGAAVVIKPISSKIAQPDRQAVKTIQNLGLAEYYKVVAKEVSDLDIYENFYKRGWTRSIAKCIRQELAPRMAQTVTLAWYMAVKDARLSK